MKKLLVLVVAILGMGTAQAQQFSVQAGTFLNKNIIAGVESDQGDQAFMGYVEFAFPIIKGKSLRLSPVSKMFFYNEGLGQAVNGIDNNYGFSGGLEVGLKLGENTELAVGYELPIPGQREAIFESILSPSLIFGKDKKVGFKINYDYFFQKKLFTYQGAISAGLIYNFN